MTSGRCAAWFLAARLTLAAWGDGRGLMVLPRRGDLALTGAPPVCQVAPREPSRLPKVRIKVSLGNDGTERL
jgi:hypothetical protein